MLFIATACLIVLTRVIKTEIFGRKAKIFGFVFRFFDIQRKSKKKRKIFFTLIQ